MAAGRLSTRERQVISKGLVDRLSYAEIARRLDRPTSTVTREVARNGGPSDYRADQAQLATRRRAHRHGARRPRAAPGSSPGQDAATQNAAGRDGAGRDGAGQDGDDRALQVYQQQLVAVLVSDGLAPMMARVLGALLVTDSGSLTAAQLADQLGVSPASVSRAVAFLVGQSLVRRVREQRRERYVVDDDLWFESTVASARGSARVSAVARRGAALLAPDSPAGQRMRDIARFSDIMEVGLVRLAEQARDAVRSARLEP